MAQSKIEEVLVHAAKKDAKAVRVACELYDDKVVELLPGDDPALSDCLLVYHLRHAEERVINRDLRSSHCALLDEELMPRSNGVIMREGHDDLRCSHGTCDYEACPVAMAACFAKLAQASWTAQFDGAGSVRIPVYDDCKDKLATIRNDTRVFRDKWEPHLTSSETALNLLLDMHENDFAGMLVLEDDSYSQEFLNELAGILVKMDKIDEGSIKRMHMMELIDKADPNHNRFKSTGDENLAPRTLYLLDRVKDFVDSNPMFGEAQKNYVVERLSHIVDDRYVIIIGDEAELRGFTDLDSRLLLTFDQHRMDLDSMPLDELYRIYLENLNAPLRKKALEDPEFEAKFVRFVGFNRDCMPFQGAELADYLAKHANSRGQVTLPKSRYQSSSLDEMLDSVVGMTQVKRTIKQLEVYSLFRQEAQAAHREMPAANKHMLFLGGPGTGKTMIARIISTMLYKIGIIRQNKCVEVTSKDLVAGYVGQTDKKTSEVIRSALGGILFIDEAYALTASGEGAAGDFGRESIAELVKAMEDYKDDLIVIFAGYEKEMSEFMEANSGMASRIGYTFHFDDYTTPELLQIFEMNAHKAGFTYDKAEIEPKLRGIFDYYRRFKNFGNGRFVMEVLQKAIIKHAAKGSGEEGYEGDYTLVSDNIPTKQELFDINDWSPRSAEDLLADLIGMEDLKAKVCEFERVVEYREQALKAGLKLPTSNLHMVFTGNPGTGKTTVARIIARILYNVGAVPTNKFIEVEANDLSAIQFRSSETAVQKQLKAAMGGILFIDEAYALLYTRDGNEIISNLVKAMEDHKGELVVMFAGYEQEMREFLDRNPGLASRVGYNFHFEDYKVDELLDIFKLKVRKAGLSLAPGTAEAARDVLRYFHGTENYGNGRFVDKLLQEVIAKHANRSDAVEFAVLEPADVPSISDMCKLVSIPIFEPSDVSAEEARRRVALHEMGHAVCRLALTGGTDIVVVTIEQEGTGALGYVQHKAQATALPTADDLENRIVELMGGMAAEELYFGAYSAGNSSDLQQATRIASNYVAKYGMSPACFVQFIGESRRNVQPTALVDLPPAVLEQIEAVMARSFERAKEVISEQKPKYDALVEVLLEESTLSGDRILELWKSYQEGDDHE